MTNDLPGTDDPGRLLAGLEMDSWERRNMQMVPIGLKCGCDWMSSYLPIRATFRAWLSFLEPYNQLLGLTYDRRLELCLCNLGFEFQCEIYVCVCFFFKLFCPFVLTRVFGKICGFFIYGEFMSIFLDNSGM